MSLSDTDTIAAIATPLGEAALGVIRMSGPQAVTVGDRVFAAARKGFALRDAASHTVHYGWIMSGPHRVDEVMLTVLRAPRTSTCEDVIEITCHGGMLTTRMVLETVLEAGARSAEPGEFTRRAFLNGRIDLSATDTTRLLASSVSPVLTISGSKYTSDV
jgi:tRNA modification GTPase